MTSTKIALGGRRHRNLTIKDISINRSGGGGGEEEGGGMKEGNRSSHFVSFNCALFIVNCV